MRRYSWQTLPTPWTSRAKPSSSAMCSAAAPTRISPSRPAEEWQWSGSHRPNPPGLQLQGIPELKWVRRANLRPAKLSEEIFATAEEIVDALACRISTASSIGCWDANLVARDQTSGTAEGLALKRNQAVSRIARDMMGRSKREAESMPFGEIGS